MSQLPDFMYQYQEGYNNMFDREGLFNMFNDKEILTKQNRITSEGINNIVAAYFIKTVQQKRSSIKPVETVISSQEQIEEFRRPGIHADLGGLTNIQLNNVNSLMRIIEKDYSK
jgi:hypothetical protein